MLTCEFCKIYGHKIASLKEKIMPILTIILILVAVGVILWLVNTYVPMDGKIKRILNIAVVIIVALWLLKVFGVLGPLKTLHT